LSRFYKVHEFAELAGVTVKALHLYDRLGLLRARRTEAGYRLYVERDLERLEQIIALKFLGLPLKRIKAVLDPMSDLGALELRDALRMQRGVLEEKQQLLARAIQAIEAAERAIEPGKPADPTILKRIIEVMDMQESIDDMKRYYSKEAWLKRKPHYEQWPSPEWRELFRDVEAALGEDPASEIAEELATRWMKLEESETGGDADVRFGMFRSWNDRRYWPPALLRRFDEFNVEGVWEFVCKAFVALRKKYYNDEAWAEVAGLSHESSAEWYELFMEVGEAVGEDAASERAQALAVRWWELAPVDGRGQALAARWKQLAGGSDGPDGTVRLIALFNLEIVWRFMAKASYPLWQKDKATHT
jgi:DNA-binding transcriptional MerR regulator